MHSLIMHAYNPDSADSLVDHLAFHKALCVLMGWNYLTPPDHSKSYQMLSADEATANRDDLVLWPPLVIIHNTITGKRDDGRMEGLGNKAMDSYLKGKTSISVSFHFHRFIKGSFHCAILLQTYNSHSFFPHLKSPPNICVPFFRTSTCVICLSI